MSTLRSAVLAGLLGAVSGCGFLAPEGTLPQAPAADPGPVQFREPPAALINGVPGQPVSYCWLDGCSDGWVNHPSVLQGAGVSSPYDVVLPEGAEIAAVTAWRPGGRNLVEVKIAHDEIGLRQVPEDAVMLAVSVYFDQGGDASYYWPVTRVAGPSPSSSS